LDILDTPTCSIPYILFKLEEIKKGEAISLREHTIQGCLAATALSPFFTLKSKSIGTFISFQRTSLPTFTNIGGAETQSRCRRINHKKTFNSLKA
jgi:hypothetical protein